MIIQTFYKGINNSECNLLNVKINVSYIITIREVEKIEHHPIAKLHPFMEKLIYNFNRM